MTRLPQVPFGSHIEQSGGKNLLLCRVLAAFLFALFAPTVLLAQSGERQDSVGEDAVDAVAQPLSDLNLRTKDIPLILVIAQRAPYDLREMDECTALAGEIERLDGVLGADADAPPERAGIVNQGLKMGGNVLGGMIPFRGLVRQISGASAEQKRWERAIYAGVARRSFLKGVMEGKACAAEEPEAPLSAREIIGMGSR